MHDAAALVPQLSVHSHNPIHRRHTTMCVLWTFPLRHLRRPGRQGASCCRRHRPAPGGGAPGSASAGPRTITALIIAAQGAMAAAVWGRQVCAQLCVSVNWTTDITGWHTMLPLAHGRTILRTTREHVQWTVRYA